MQGTLPESQLEKKFPEGGGVKQRCLLGEKLRTRKEGAKESKAARRCRVGACRATAKTLKNCSLPERNTVQGKLGSPKSEWWGPGRVGILYRRNPHKNQMLDMMLVDA